MKIWPAILILVFFGAGLVYSLLWKEQPWIGRIIDALLIWFTIYAIGCTILRKRTQSATPS